VVVNNNPAALGKGAAYGDEELNIMAVDPFKRGIAGAIDIVAEGT
jgi:5-formyltetrahydrofolate cyclo-ligase